MKETKSYNEIDLKHIIDLMLKKWYIIILLALLCGSAAFGYVRFLVTPTYESTATLIVSGGSSLSTTYQELVMGQYLSQDYPYVLKANYTLELIADELNNNTEFPENDGKPYREYTPSVLSGMISSEAIEDSRIFCINVTSSDPNEARVVAAVATEKFLYRIEEEGVIIGGKARVVDYPITPTASVSAGAGRSAALGFLVGFLLGSALVVLLGITNDVITKEDWLINTYGEEIPVLATIPEAGAKGSGHAYGYHYGYGRKQEKRED